VHIKDENTIENLDTGLVLREGPDSITQTTVFHDDGTVEIIARGLGANVFGMGKGVGRVVLVSIDGGHSTWCPRRVSTRSARPTTGPLVQALAAFCDVLLSLA
jgi:hypothetical protein